MSSHALLAPSAAHRWINCPPSARLEATIEDKGSAYAEEGTVAHELAEIRLAVKFGLISNYDHWKRLKKIRATEYYSEEMEEYVDEYIELVLDIYEKSKDPFAEVEVKLDLSKYVPESFGSCDATIVDDGVLYIFDLKYGKGVSVQAEGNSQLKLYALGAYNRYKAVYDIEKIKMYIVQPRKTGISVSELLPGELTDWAESIVRPAAELAYKGEGEYNPGPETCRFCKASAICKKRAEFFKEKADKYLGTVLTPEEMGETLKELEGIETWLANLKAALESKLLSGEVVKGWKIVAGRSNRKYTDEAAIAEALKAEGIEDFYQPRKILTITNMEKRLGKKVFNRVVRPYVIKPEGKPTLAEESDKREALNIRENIINAFDEEK